MKRPKYNECGRNHLPNNKMLEYHKQKRYIKKLEKYIDYLESKNKKPLKHLEIKDEYSCEPFLKMGLMM